MNLYRPSNGTEGLGFMENFCAHCIHEKWYHTQHDGDRKCDILNRALIYNTKDKEYPVEWQYDATGHPTCTARVHHDWGKRGDDDFPRDPEPPPAPYDPMQLCFPFMLDEYLTETELELSPSLPPPGQNIGG